MGILKGEIQSIMCYHPVLGTLYLKPSPLGLMALNNSLKRLPRKIKKLVKKDIQRFFAAKRKYKITGLIAWKNHFNL